ncbi:LacI family DNA-binding transcriptional regulator [Luteolibacter ambystomatis]|uniref:LacI family DNA-binding transcriptional regulator n=1 Tax=Luteolibacter ambystomatis TaxID=2824561 RepID=A0A975G7Y4_9BACT|nr:LacI family DNA-binding transcriptional regulator [Luteolibacter ambystomatis]QUE51004.1 LacI family DNA-binding transcriptional regulator [Luteolibacter ambystomatis]
MNTPSILHRVTQKDLAKALKIAQSTVSMALRDDPSIPAGTREEIRQAAQEMGYRPNPTGTALAHFRASSRNQPVHAALAWLNCWEDPLKLRSYGEFDGYWHGAADAADSFGYRLEEFVVDRRMTLERLGGILRTRHIHGILLPPGPLPAGWERFDWEAFSVVRLSHPARQNDLVACTVAGDQMKNGLLAFDSMRQLGYSRIGYCGLYWQERLFCAGYLWGQHHAEEEAKVPPLLLGNSERDEWWQRFGAWYELHRPDAILTDLPEVPEMLAAMGRKVPADVGLAAMGVLDCGIRAGINQNPREIGRTGVTVLTSLIHERNFGLPPVRRSMLIGGSWVNGPELPNRRIHPDCQT